MRKREKGRNKVEKKKDRQRETEKERWRAINFLTCLTNTVIREGEGRATTPPSLSVETAEGRERMQFFVKYCKNQFVCCHVASYLPVI